MTLKEKLENLRKSLGQDYMEVRPSVKSLFGMSYVPDLFTKKTKCWFNIEPWKGSSTDLGKLAREVVDYWQPITITYKRCGIIFFKFDNYPKFGEDYFHEDSMNYYTTNIYPRKIEMSKFFKNKIKRLKEKNPDELKLQVSFLKLDDMEGRIEIVNDLDEFTIK